MNFKVSEILKHSMILVELKVMRKNALQLNIYMTI